MGDGHFSPAGIDCSYACLYYSLLIQHISVPWVLYTQHTYSREHVIHWVHRLTVGTVT